MKKDAEFWSRQIESAKQEHKDWLKNCEKIGKAYTDKNVRENLLYSNTQTLLTALVNNKPIPEISRRFWNGTEQDPIKTKLYNVATKIAQANVEYYFDECDALSKVKDMVKKDLLFGRGVLWVEYEPVIKKIEVEAKNVLQTIGQAVGLVEKEYIEKITDRKLKIVSLGVNDYLQSWGENCSNVWWKARRHLCDKDTLKERFNYDAEDNELTYGQDKDKGSQQKVAEVWEIWDKTKKERIYFMPSGYKKKILEISQDPYRLNGFYPCIENSFITENDCVIPVPEYTIYSKNAEEINRLSAKNHQLQEKVRYVILCRQKDAKDVEQVQRALDGDIVGITDFAGDSSVFSQALDVRPVVDLINQNNAEIVKLKNSIYEITGISDIMRGASDARETAEAQRIKGYYGGLRFKDRQDIVQNVFLRLFRIVAEILCEHWDFETLSNISAVDLPTEIQKQMILSQGQEINEPTQEEIIQLLRDDKMRSFVIAIESSATAFDDMVLQTTQVQELVDSTMKIMQLAQQMSSPIMLKTFIPLVKMKMSTIKVSNAISSQLLETIEEMSKQIENQPVQPSNEQIRLNGQMQLEQMRMNNDMNLQSQKLAQDRDLELAKLDQNMQIATGKLGIEQDKLALKNKELEYERQANDARVVMGIAPDTNIG